jgi:AbrB family looped-hinge helix DNA binding protein
MSMEKITVSSKGQIAIPKAIRDTLNLSEGTQLIVEVRGQEIVLLKEPAWRKLHGAGGPDLMSEFGDFKKREREREDSRP